MGADRVCPGRRASHGPGKDFAYDRIAAEAKRHWAFQPVVDPFYPEVKTTTWPRTSVDRFILARLEGKGLSPSPQADKRTLIRRATFDLTGLPPTPEEVEAFEADAAPDAFERLIDRLLASPRYGERWGRYWLDVARYADTKGYILFQDANFHWAYTYRDYVIGAFNHDLPYDRFVIEQIAADRLAPADGKKPLSALGFLTLGGRFMGNVHDVIDDRIDVVCRGLMSLTVTCARCHDHKFDPIPAQDYYSLYGVLASAREPDIPPEADEPAHTPRVFAVRQGARVAAAKAERVRGGQASTKWSRRRRRRAAEYLLAAQKALDQPTHRRLHAARRRNRPEPDDAGSVAEPIWRGRARRTTRSSPRGMPWRACRRQSSREVPASVDREVRLANELPPTEVSHRPANPVVLRALAARPPRLADRGRSGLWAIAQRRRATLARQGSSRCARRANGRASSRAGPGVVASGVPRPG